MAERLFGSGFRNIQICGIKATRDTPIMAFKKIDKEFVLSDSSENAYGYRLLTPGYLMDEFAKNPIGYYNHDKTSGVLVKWDGLRIEGDRVLGTPTINMQHPRGERTATEIEEGFLNAASVGKLTFVDAELEDNPDDPENPGFIITKWYNRECSLVDNPANRGAMKVEVFDQEGNELNLEDRTETLKKFKIGHMKKVTLTLTLSPKLLQILSLKDDATAEALEEGIISLHTENESLTGENTTLKGDVQKLNKDLADERKATTDGKIDEIIDKGVTEGRITKAAGAKLKVQFADKPKELSDLVSDMPVYQSLADRINNSTDIAKDLHDGDWDVLDRSGKLPMLKEKHPELYKEKFEAKFGKK